MVYLARRHQPGRLTYASRAAIHIWIHALPHYHVSQGSRQSQKRTSEGTKGISEQQNVTSRARRSTRALVSHPLPPRFFAEVEAVRIALTRGAMHNAVPGRWLPLGDRARTR